MPDLLILGNDPRSSEALEDLARSLSFRVKSSFDPETAEKWLETAHFDMLLIHSKWPFECHQTLATMLWQRNSLAEYIVYSFDQGLESSLTQQRLFGATLAIGQGAMNTIRRALERFNPRGIIRSEDVSILVVEDLDSPRDIVCSYIERLGYPNVQGVPSASAALRSLKSQQKNFTLIVTDLKMPDMSGKELIEQVRGSKYLASIPILVLTAYGSADQLIDCILAGASGFLTKPPKKTDLLREIQRAIRISASRSDPRLAQAGEEQALREFLSEKGIH